MHSWQNFTFRSRLKIKFLANYILSKLFNAFVLIAICINASTYAQGENGGMSNIADDYISKKNFTGTIILYQRILDEDPNNADINFKLGFCYLNTANEKDKAIQYIEKPR